MVESGRRKHRDLVPIHSTEWSDSGWVGAGADDDLDERLEAETAEFDEALPHVLTMLGPIEPAALGVTLVGGWQRPLVAAGADPGAVLLEHEQLHAIGVRALVDLASAGTEHGWSDLTWLSARSPVHVVAARPAVTEMASDVPGAGRAGALSLTAPAGRAANGRGALLPVFVPDSRLGSGQGDEPEGSVAGEQVILAGPALGRRPDEWAKALDRVAFVALLIAGRGGDDELASAAVTVNDLAARGLSGRLLLGYEDDPFVIMERFPLALMDAGLSAASIRQMLVDNPASALTIASNAAEGDSSGR